MRLFLLLIVLIETAWIGLELGNVSDHYVYLDKVYEVGLQNCLDTLNFERKQHGKI